MLSKYLVNKFLLKRRDGEKLSGDTERRCRQEGVHVCQGIRLFSGKNRLQPEEASTDLGGPSRDWEE